MLLPQVILYVYMKVPFYYAVYFCTYWVMFDLDVVEDNPLDYHFPVFEKDKCNIGETFIWNIYSYL